MSKIIDFTIALEQDQNVRRAYTADPEATMLEHGLSDREIDAIRSGDESTIYRATGMTDDCTVAKLVIVIPPAKKAA